VLKKGAMFGLDARITIIIFTALGLITFASFSKQVTGISATQYITDMKSIIQAYNNFKNDTNYKLTSYSNPYFYNISELVSLTIDNSKPYTKKYKGPYIDFKIGTTNNFLTHSFLENNIAFVSRSFAKSWSSATGTQKCSDTDCFTWLVLYQINKDTAKEIDIIVDGKDSASTGSIRLIANGLDYDVFMAAMPE